MKDFLRKIKRLCVRFRRSPRTREEMSNQRRHEIERWESKESFEEMRTIKLKKKHDERSKRGFNEGLF